MTRVIVNRENRETTDAYERYVRSVSARDVLGAWALALALFLGLAVSSLVQEAFSDRSIGVTAPKTAFGPGEIRTGHQDVLRRPRLGASTRWRGVTSFK